ncbi:hypothetical protein FPRO04_01402 [Fusarium proliferatum]|nr:hypothetical protein FPRO04_01402 [Fusarium proliferatum]
MVWGLPSDENASFKDKLALKFRTLFEKGFRNKKGSEAIQPLQGPTNSRRTHFSQSRRQLHQRVAIQAFLSSDSTQSQPSAQRATAPQVFQRSSDHIGIPPTAHSSCEQANTDVKALPQSRNMIFYDLPVSSTPFSAEEFRKRFEYVTNELRKVVAEHNELRMCGRHMNYSRHMIGDSRDTAVPSILIECRKRDLKMLRELLNKHAGTLCCRKDSNWPTLVHHDLPSSKPSFQLIYLPHPYHPTIQHAANTSAAVSNSSRDTFCGSLVQYEGRTATIGLTIIVDGISHMMTVDHLFNNSMGDENSLFTSGDEPVYRSSSSGESTSALQDTSVIPPNHPDQEKQTLDFGHSRAHESAAEDNLNASHTKELPQSRLAVCLVGQPVPLPHTLDPPASYLDWAFVELNDSSASFQLPNIITLDSMSSPVLLHQVSKQLPSHTTSVYMISGINGIRKGRLFSGLSELGPLQDRSPCKAWKMILDSDQGLEPGECGSIIVDQATFDIYGHVVGSNIIGDIFVVPLSDTIEQVRFAFNATTVILPSQNLILPSYSISKDTIATQAGLSTIEPRSTTVLNHLHSVHPKSSLGSSSITQTWNRSEDPRNHSNQFNGSQRMFYSEQEGTSYLQTLKESGVLDGGAEVPALLLDYPSSRSTERSIERIEDFCCGASFALDNFVSHPLDSSLYASSDAITKPTVTNPRTEVPYFAVVTDINEIQWWGSCQHHLRFQFPFFKLVSEGYNDPRTMSKAGEPFRTRLSISFLTQCSGETLLRQHGQVTLCESVISFGIAVYSIDYWDVYCFEEGDADMSIFGFDFEDQESGSESDFQMPEEMLRHSPRTYFLYAVNLSLDRVLDQHAEILEVFQDFIKGRGRYSSKSAKQRNGSAHNNRQLKEVICQLLHSVTVLTRNVQEFLSNDPRKDLEGVPHGGGFVDGTGCGTFSSPTNNWKFR